MPAAQVPDPKSQSVQPLKPEEVGSGFKAKEFTPFNCVVNTVLPEPFIARPPAIWTPGPGPLVSIPTLPVEEISIQAVFPSWMANPPESARDVFVPINQSPAAPLVMFDGLNPIEASRPEGPTISACPQSVLPLIVSNEPPL